MPPKSLELSKCVKQGSAMWCFLASYLTVINHKNPEKLTSGSFSGCGLDVTYTLTDKENKGFMDKIFNLCNAPENVKNGSVGFKRQDHINKLGIESINLSQRKVFEILCPSRNIPRMAVSPIQISKEEKVYQFFNYRVYDDKYVILKFKKPPHFCVLHKIDKNFGLEYFDPRNEHYTNFHRPIITTLRDKIVVKNHDLGPLSYVYVL